MGIFCNKKNTGLQYYPQMPYNECYEGCRIVPSAHSLLGYVVHAGGNVLEFTSN